MVKIERKLVFKVPILVHIDAAVFVSVELNLMEFYLYRVSGHNGQVFDGNFPSLDERCVKTEVM